MCGITGFWQASIAPEERMYVQISAMNDTMAHRGPDDRGVWVERENGVALGNRRLAILDLSPAGHQPMVSQCGRYVIVYNGEVYNSPDLRRELEGSCRFRGFSDTEAILEGCAHWGIVATLERLIGMFAFALWDRKGRILTLVRDRLGVKPLYYGRCGGTFLFGSEMKALCAYPQFAREVDRNSLALFLRHNYIPYPYTIYRGIYELPPGHLLNLTSCNSDIAPVAYWSAHTIVKAGIEHPFTGTVEEAIEQLDALLRNAVKMRMLSDVPLGAFLSGGIDSSTIVAMMQSQSSRRVKTFSIGFYERQYDEAPYARKVAKHLGTEHTEFYVTSEQAQEVIPSLAEVYDEPFADSSQIPTLLLSHLTRQQVTVSLSGDGGDELFAGYDRYLAGQYLWRYLSKVPVFLRTLVSRGIYAISPGQWDSLCRALSPILRFRFHLAGDKLHKLAAMVKVGSGKGMYWQMVSHWNQPDRIVVGATEPPTPLSSNFSPSDIMSAMMYWDLITYLPCDLLTKVDRASMAKSLEVRVPFLDHRVVAFVWSLPLTMKLRNGQNKWLLKQVLYRYVPESLVKRPKMGFGVPIGDWLRGPLRPWAESLLNRERLVREGFFHPQPILQKWSEHLSGKYNWQYLIWDVLIFQMWQQRWLRQSPG